MSGPPTRNYSYVRSRILRLLEAEENEEAQALVSDWIDSGELDVYQRLRAHWMIRVAKGTINADSELFLPRSYIEMISICPYDGGKPLEAILPDQAGPWFGRGGPAEKYLIEGELLTVLPRQSSQSVYRFTYFSSDNNLTEPADQSILIQKAPQLLAFAGARHGAIHFGDQGLADTYGKAAQDIIDTINQTAARARVGSGYTIKRG